MNEEENKELLELTAENVEEIFFNCTFNGAEDSRVWILNERPISNFTIARFKNLAITFSTEKINKYKPQIAYFIDHLVNIDENRDLAEIALNSDGKLWTKNHVAIIQLVQLGLATEILDCVYYSGLFKSPNLNTDIPYIKRLKENINIQVIGQDPSEYPNRYNNGTSNSTKEEDENLDISFSNNFKKNFQYVEEVFNLLGFKAKLTDKDIILYDLDDNIIDKMKITKSNIITKFSAHTPKGELSFDIFPGTTSAYGEETTHNHIGLDSYIINGEAQSHGKHISTHLVIAQDDDAIKQMNFLVSDPHADNYVTNLNIKNDGFEAQVNNLDMSDFSISSRLINYNDIKTNPVIKKFYFLAFESHRDYEESALSLRTSSNRNESFVNKVFSGKHQEGMDTTMKFDINIPTEDVDLLARGLLASTRSKNLVEHVLNSLEKNLPGINDYILANNKVMRNVKTILDTNNFGSVIQGSEKLFETYRIANCDLPDEKENNPELKK